MAVSVEVVVTVELWCDDEEVSEAVKRETATVSEEVDLMSDAVERDGVVDVVEREGVSADTKADRRDGMNDDEDEGEEETGVE